MDDPLSLFSVLTCYVAASRERTEKSQGCLRLFYIALSGCSFEGCQSFPGGGDSVLLSKTRSEGSQGAALRNPLMSAVCSRDTVRSDVLAWLQQP